MDSFADIFLAYQKRGNTSDQKGENAHRPWYLENWPCCAYPEIDECNKVLEPWTKPEARGRRRADADGDTFTIKWGCRTLICLWTELILDRCVGVFDTVGAIGLPDELRWTSHVKGLFGFPDKHLGPHIEHAFHAMGLHETRADFVSH